MTKKKLENEIQNDIFDLLITLNVFFWRSNNIPVFGRNNAGKYQYRSLPRHTPKGLPDITIIHKGKYIAVEVKREGAKLSPEQVNFGTNVVKNGGAYIVAHSAYECEKLFQPYL